MKIHIVKKGDTLYTIATKYEVPLQKLIDANPNLKDPNKLEVGMKIKIPVEAKPVKPEYEMMHKHDVKKGDTLWKLAKAWGIPLQDMLKANPQLKDPNILSVGEVVYIPKVTGTMPMEPQVMPPHDGGMNVSPPMSNTYPGVSPMHEAHHHHHHHHDGKHMGGHHHHDGGDNYPHHHHEGMHMGGHHHDGMHMGGDNYPYHHGHQPVYTMPTNNCGCNTLSTHMPYDMYKGHPGDSMSQDLFAQFQVPATEALSLYDLPQVPQVNTSANWGGMPQGGYDGYPMPYGMNPYGMMDPYGMQMHPYGYPSGGYGMPSMPFNPYGMAYAHDMYAPQVQPSGVMDHTTGSCGCHPRENEGTPVPVPASSSASASAVAPAPAKSEPAKKSNSKSSSFKAKARTSAKKSSSSTRRQTKPRKSRSMPWING
ncbi:LysM peptidoglycan-binding domain-containing protein [Paenibacillus guangzhouensis]|uniref:LysM peptidoglycan-binding domain-containing protein n=1 Tax=Paenibacillus guangzhouensis TaxID=1473112 RepID=UPI001D10D693|nr:LysM domain-containing protein [Paenibacillus guangzhouensis]